MFRNAYQSGLLSIFYSCGSNPLDLWEPQVKNGHIQRLTDSDVRSIVLEIRGSNVSTTYITCPKGNKQLGITLPYMVMIVKNLKKHFTFEVTVMDQTGARRRFRISNFQNSTQILPLCTTMPITLNDGWNQIQFNLAEFTKRSYKTQFMEVVKLKINANIRLRRVYFTESLLPDDQLPPEYRLYIPPPPTKSRKVDETKGKENVKPFKFTKRTSRDGSKLSIQTIKQPSDRVSNAQLQEKQLTDAISEKPETTVGHEGEPSTENEPVTQDGVPTTAEDLTEIDGTVVQQKEGSVSENLVAGEEGIYESLPVDPVVTDLVPTELVPTDPVPTGPEPGETIPVEPVTTETME